MIEHYTPCPRRIDKANPGHGDHPQGRYMTQANPELCGDLDLSVMSEPSVAMLPSH